MDYIFMVSLGLEIPYYVLDGQISSQNTWQLRVHSGCS